MMMRIGYACKLAGVPGPSVRGCTKRMASEERLREVIAHNLQALNGMLDYNTEHGIKLFRISSDIIPFGSSPVNTVPWRNEYEEELAALGEKALAAGMRLSMHPGQYTVLNSPNEETVRGALEDLVYHADFLDGMGLGREHKLILHIGGAYGDKASAVARFEEKYQTLPEQVKRRLVIENDDRIYTIEEVLGIGRRMGIPVVFDNLHHKINPSGQISEAEWISACARTWTTADGPQKIHYSQQAAGKRPGSHSRMIHTAEFLEFAGRLPSSGIDVMLEVKDKNLSALKCMLCLDGRGSITRLEQEWARYKYTILENSPRIYQKIRQLLKDKSGYPAREFCALLDQALESIPDRGSTVNALQHIWGYFKDCAAPKERERFALLMERGEYDAARRHLLRLAEKHNQEYLLDSYYFWINCD